MLSEIHAAKLWDNPKGIVEVEEGRYPAERALAKIVGATFRKHLLADALIVEGGAGSGYLKSLVPSEYHPNYFSSDYNLANLKEGLKRRSLTAITASVCKLPLRDESIDCLVDLDAYDTLPNLSGALAEAKRVLKPNGIFMHFQVNYPSDDTVEADYPGYIFFPAKSDKSAARGMMMGVTPDNLKEGLKYITTAPFKGIVQDFLDNPEEAFVRTIQHPEPHEVTNVIYQILDSMPVDKIVIPSLPDYFRNKLHTVSSKGGLQIVESEFKATSLRLARSKSQLKYSNFNQFSIEQGSGLFNTNIELKMSGSMQVIEKTSILVFVAKNLPSVQ